MSPINRSMTRRPASLHRVPEGAGSPASPVLSGRSDFLPPVPRHFVSFARRYHRDACVRSWEPDADSEAWGLSGAVLPRTACGGSWQDLPRSWGTPIVPLPCSPTPAGSTTPGCRGVATRPPRYALRRRPTSGYISGLNDTASALAVYASPDGSPRHDARLASGCQPGSAGRGWIPAGFHRKVSELASYMAHPPSPSFTWRKYARIICFITKSG